MKFKGLTELISWGIVLLLLLAVLSRFTKDEPKQEAARYDERQILARGKAFEWGFYTGLAYLLLVQFALIIWQEFPFAVRDVTKLGLILMLGVFIGVCIWKEAYTRPGEKEGLSIFILFYAGFRYLLEWTLLKEDWFDLALGVVFCFEGLLLLLRRHLRKREEREEADG